MSAGVGDFDELVERAVALLRPDRRAVLGIAGSPGAGKTTLARGLVAALAAAPPPGESEGWVVHVPMDGFHLADVELARLGRADRKGAPDTFDAAGYAALLARVRAPAPDEIVYAPMFERDIEQPVAGAIPVTQECRLIVTEGNYLLVDQPEWRRVRDMLDEVWFCAPDDELRLQRLIRRHVEFGKPPELARTWVLTSDERNAQLVERYRDTADVVVLPAAIPPPQPAPPA